MHTSILAENTRNLPHTGDLFSIHGRFDERRSLRRQLCSQFGIMSHVFGSRSTICQYKGVTRGSLHTNSGAEQLVILNTRNPLETHGPPLPSFLHLVLSSPDPPPPCPLPSFNPRRSSVFFHYPDSIPPARLGYNARQIGDSIEHYRIHYVARCNR